MSNQFRRQLKCIYPTEPEHLQEVNKGFSKSADADQQNLHLFN